MYIVVVVVLLYTVVIHNTAQNSFDNRLCPRISFTIVIRRQADIIDQMSIGTGALSIPSTGITCYVYAVS